MGPGIVALPLLAILTLDGCGRPHSVPRPRGENIAANVRVLSADVLQAPNDSGEATYWARITWKNVGERPISIVHGRYVIRGMAGEVLEDFEYTVYLEPPIVQPGETTTRLPPRAYAIGSVAKYRLEFGGEPVKMEFTPTEAYEVVD